jgi:hypothetical protein
MFGYDITEAPDDWQDWEFLFAKGRHSYLNSLTVPPTVHQMNDVCFHTSVTFSHHIILPTNNQSTSDENDPSSLAINNKYKPFK